CGRQPRAPCTTVFLPRRASGFPSPSCCVGRWMLLSWPYRASHPEDAKMGRFDRLVQRSREREPEDFARIGRIDHTIVPQPRAREIGMTFALVLRAQGRLERGLRVCAPGTTLGVD